MLGKLFAAFVGRRAARHIGGLSGTTGALLGLGLTQAPRSIRRLGTVAALVGAGYAFARSRKTAPGRNTERNAAPEPQAPMGGPEAKPAH